MLELLYLMSWKLILLDLPICVSWLRTLFYVLRAFRQAGPAINMFYLMLIETWVYKVWELLKNVDLSISCTMVVSTPCELSPDANLCIIQYLWFLPWFSTFLFSLACVLVISVLIPAPVISILILYLSFLSWFSTCHFSPASALVISVLVPYLLVLSWFSACNFCLDSVVVVRSWKRIKGKSTC